MNAPQHIVYRERLPAGCHTSIVLRRGYGLRLLDVSGGANVGALFFNRDDLTERYNMPDTLKAQHTAFLCQDCVLYSDMGRVLASIVEDTAGWHDTVCGTSSSGDVARQYGELAYEQARNGYRRNGRDGLLMQLGRFGLSERDLGANVNFFARVDFDAEGNLRHVADHSQAGTSVELRADMNLVVLLTTAPHPLRAARDYPTGDVELSVRRLGLAAADDACRLRCPENERGFRNTEDYFAQLPIVESMA